MLLLNNITVKATIYESANSLVYQGIKNYDNTPVILNVLKEDYPSPHEIVRYKNDRTRIANSYSYGNNS